jgi:hypothetical protein
VSCAICHTRKERRFCPALHERICAPCCGREREVTLDCPSECEYLHEARRHERRSLEDVDPALLFPEVEVREELIYEREPLIAGLGFALARAARRDRTLRDPDAIAAISAVARKLRTLLDSGLHVPAENISPAQQALAKELEQTVSEYRQAEEKHIGYATLKDSELVQALVFMVRMAHARTSGRSRSRAFLDFVTAQFPESAAAVQSAPGQLVIP